MLEICFISWMSFYLMRYFVLVRSLPLCGTFSKFKCYSCHDYMCCSKARRHFPNFFPVFLLFPFSTVPWTTQSGLWCLFKQMVMKKWYFFSLATAQSCGSLTVEHTEHLMLAGSDFSSSASEQM